MRYYYYNSIAKFLTQSDEEIIGTLTYASANDINQQTTYAWSVEIQTMKKALRPYGGRGSIFMEYNIPRMGRRIDVVTVIDGIILIWEYKAGGEGFNREAITQVWDYALDLKYFHEGSCDRAIVPILVATDVEDENCNLELNVYDDNVYEPLLVNVNELSECIELVIGSVKTSETKYPDDLSWAASGYSPTPTIVEAAVALFNNHNVADITRHDGDITATSKAIDDLIEYSRENNRKAICFVTGVPGAGKTLIGLQTAIKHTADSGAVYLSGNHPLVQVLQEALARDYVKQDRAREKAEKAEGQKNAKKATTKKEATSKVKEFIQMIHHYRDTYLEGIRVNPDKNDLEVVPGYFALDKNKDKSYVPHEHVVIFDEAQRAWDQPGLSKFLNDKSKGRENLLKDFPYSEPEFLISTIERHSDWGVVICLIGGGQEINHNEAGIQDWMDSINRRFKDWDVYISDKLTDKEYADKDGKIVTPANPDCLNVTSSLHLPMSMRSFRAEKVSQFVHQLLDLKKDEARKTLESMENYPLVLTRNLDTAKNWLRKKARGSERYGLLASSKAERLKAISINVRYQPDFVQWFLADEDDIRSSNCLEDTLTEFKVQGLEIDWACVAWDADLRLDKTHKHWEHYQLKNGANWQHIHKEINQAYQINAYRVLLTRARQGMVIVVPNGDYSVPPDETRKPEWYDGIYNYLKEIGIPEI